MQYFNTLKFGGIISKLIHNKLIRRYGIFVSPSCSIGIGLRIYHPTSIVITNAVIGDNFTIFQNCTIGQKYAGKDGYGMVPNIGNNCSMYAGSSIIGNVKVTDGVTIGVHACLLRDAIEPGIYLGTPAKKTLIKIISKLII